MVDTFIVQIKINESCKQKGEDL